MSDATSETIRNNARVVGILLQCLAVVTLFGSSVAGVYIADKGQQYLGVTASHDPVSWIVIGIGVMASLMFAGLGYSLAMLCALYDRQITAAPTERSSQLRPSTEWRPPPAREVLRREPPAPTRQETGRASVIAPTPSKRGLWAALTKERHFKKPRD